VAICKPPRRCRSFSAVSINKPHIGLLKHTSNSRL
jgi:hypothetical protein